MMAGILKNRFDEDNQWIEYYVKNKDAETLGKLYEKYKKQSNYSGVFFQSFSPCRERQG